MATAKKVAAGDKIKAADHNSLVDDVENLETKKVKWADVDGKPTTFDPKIGTTATTALAGNTSIPTVPGKMTAAEATTGTATTARTIDAKTLSDFVDAKIAAAKEEPEG